MSGSNTTPSAFTPLPKDAPPSIGASARAAGTFSNGVPAAVGQEVIAAATAETWLDAARLWAGIANIVPIRRGEKQPGINGWEKLGRVSAEQIREWDASGLYGGIGIRPGAQSGNLVIIDFDGMASYDAFAAQFPGDAETYTEQSGSRKGMHALFFVDVLPQRRTTKLRRSVIIDEQVVGVEVFYDSGQVVVAPSMHPSGNRYEMVKALPIRRLADVQHIIDWIEALPSPQKPVIASGGPARPAVPTKPGAHRAYALKALNNMASDVARLTSVENDFQNDTCYLNTWKAAHFAARGDLSRSEIFAAMESAMRANGYIAAFGYHAFSKTFESGYTNGVGDNTYVPKCYQAPAPKPVRRARRDQRAAAASDYAQAPERPKPLTLWQNAMFLYTAETYPLIAHYVARLPQVHFSVAEYAEAAGVTVRTARKRINAALVWGAVSRWYFLQDRGGEGTTICKKYQRQKRGAAVGERYILTPDRAMPMIERELWNAVLETLERGIPDTIFKDEAAEAFPKEGTAFAARLQAVTTAAADSSEAEKVRDDDEHLAVRIADEIKRRAQYDETPLTMDIDPSNVRYIRRRAIESLVATNPSEPWLQGAELSQVAGAKRSAVPNLIKTSRLTPSAKPTLTPVMLSGHNLYAEALVAARRNKGAPTAWIDANKEIIRGFSSSAPSGAAGVLINQGKTYSRHERPERMPKDDSEQETALTEPFTREQEAEQEEKRATKRARSGMILRLRGGMRARGWRYIPGAFGYWERVAQDEQGKVIRREFADNTAEGMAGALVADYEWAVQQDVFLADLEAVA